VFEAKQTNPDEEFKVADDELSEIRWIGPEDVAGLTTWEDWRTLLTDYFKTHA
jgi:isopentenyldiphosphate isomerase